MASKNVIEITNDKRKHDELTKPMSALLKQGRAGIGHDNYGAFRLVEAYHNIIVLGEHFDASLEDVDDFLKDC